MDLKFFENFVDYSGLYIFIVHFAGAFNFIYILRDFKNAPFYILCLFHMVYLRMVSSSFYKLLQNGP